MTPQTILPQGAGVTSGQAAPAPTQCLVQALDADGVRLPVSAPHIPHPGDIVDLKMRGARVVSYAPGDPGLLTLIPPSGHPVAVPYPAAGVSVTSRTGTRWPAPGAVEPAEDYDGREDPVDGKPVPDHVIGWKPEGAR